MPPERQRAHRSLRQIWPVKRTFLFIGVVAVATMAAALSLPIWVAGLPVALAVLSWGIPPLRRPVWLLIVSTVALCWLTSGAYRLLRVEPLMRLDGQTVTLSGWVEETNYFPRFHLLRVTAGDGVPAGTRVLLYAEDRYAPQLYEQVTARVELSSGFSRPADGIVLSAFPADYGEGSLHIAGRMERLPPSHWLRPVRQWLTDTLCRYLPGEEGGVLAAICLGERSHLSAETEAAFRGSGLSHLLVVSGLHVSMVTLAVMGLLLCCRLSRRAAIGVTMVVVLLFAWLIGPSPSVVRAVVMGWIWLSGLLLRQRSEGLNALGLAATVLLLANPYTVQDGGFQLSFAATAGVLALTPRISGPWLRECRPDEPGVRFLLKSAWNTAAAGLGACLAAILSTLPLLCYYFRGFSLAAPVSNLLVLLPGSGVLLLGFLGMGLCGVPGGGLLGTPVLALAGLLAKYLLCVARWCDAYLPVCRPWQIVWICGCCGLLIAGICLLRRENWLRLTAVLTALSLLAGGLQMALDHRMISVTLQATPSGPVALVQCSEGNLLLASHSGALEQGAALLEREGIDHLATLYVGVGETTHTAGVGSAQQILYMGDACWLAGISHPSRPLVPGAALELGAVTITFVAADVWLIRTGEHTLAVGGTDLSQNAEMLVLTGTDTTPVPAAAQTIYLYAEPPSPEELSATAGGWVCVGDPMTLTAPVEGEWSMTVWR